MLAILIFQSGMDWQPYRLHEKEMFQYHIVQKEEGSVEEGDYTISINGNQLSIKGTWENKKGSVTVQVDDPEQIPGQLFAQMMFNPWLAPLGVTLFANTMIMPLALMGSSYMEQSEDGTTTKVEKGKPCSHAGKSGKELKVFQNGKLVYNLCVAKDVGLPLYMKMVSDDGSEYEVELVKYSR